MDDHTLSLILQDLANITRDPYVDKTATWFEDSDLKSLRISGPANENLTIEDAIQLMSFALTDWNSRESMIAICTLLIELAECTIGTPELSGVLKKDIGDSFKTWTHVDYVPKLKEFLDPDLIEDEENIYCNYLIPKHLVGERYKISPKLEKFLIEAGDTGPKIIGCWAMSHLKLISHDFCIYIRFHTIKDNERRSPFQNLISSLYKVELPEPMPMISYDMRKFFHHNYTTRSVKVCAGFYVRAAYHIKYTYEKNKGLKEILETFGYNDAIESKLPLYYVARRAARVYNVSIIDLIRALNGSRYKNGSINESSNYLLKFLSSYLEDDFGSIYWPVAQNVDHKLMTAMGSRRNGSFLYMCYKLIMIKQSKEEHRIKEDNVNKLRVMYINELKEYIPQCAKVLDEISRNNDDVQKGIKPNAQLA